MRIIIGELDEAVRKVREAREPLLLLLELIEEAF